jgi:tripeptidyl-peptidase-2
MFFMNCSALLSDLLYESEFESQLWMLFDSNKQLIATGDAYPCKVSTNMAQLTKQQTYDLIFQYMVKVEKGDFVLRMHVRHEKRELLDRITDLTLLLSQKLPSTLSLDVYTSHSQALVGGKKAQACILSPGATQPIYIAPLANEKSVKYMINCVCAFLIEFDCNCYLHLIFRCTKGATIGQYLSGTISYAKDEIGKKVVSIRCVIIIYIYIY